MAPLDVKKALVVWSLCFCVGMSQVPEPKLPETRGCPKWFLIVKNRGKPACGGALVTHIMAITSCPCVCTEFEKLVVRQPVSQFTVTIQQNMMEMTVDMIVPHPMCDLQNPEFAKFGTALIKMSWAITLDPKTIMPASLYTLRLESEFQQFNKLLKMPSVKCGVMLKTEADLAISSKTECRYRSGVECYVDVKLYQPAACIKYCNERSNASCPEDLDEYDMYCLQVLNGQAQSLDPIKGTPLVCDGRAWGVMTHFHRDIPNFYFFYGISSIVEIYSMAVTFSVGNDCGGNKIVISQMRSRKSEANNLHSTPMLNAIPLVILSIINICY